VRLARLAQTYMLAGRLREIVGVFSSHGFWHIVRDLRLTRYAPLANRIRGPLKYDEALSAPERLRMAMEELGPTFVKLGQLLSARPDIVGESFAVEFARLREKVAPISFEKVEREINNETGKTLEELFEYFEKEPLASASIAQVHRARLKDGRKVVVKVRRPGVGRVVNRDLAVLQLMLTAGERYVEETKELDLHTILDEFSRSLRRELDFFLEASNSERLRREADREGEIIIPEVVWEFTTESIIVFDEIEGVSPTDNEGIEALGADRSKMASALARAVIKQVLIDGVFHADLHGGNIRVTAGGKLALLDFGAIGYLSEEMRESIGNLLFSVISRDYAALVEEFVRIGYCEEVVDERAFERDLREIIEPYYGRPLGDLRIGEILGEGIRIGLRHKVRVPPELVMLGRTLLVAEEVIRSLDPGTMILNEAMPFAQRLLVKRMDPRRHLKLMQKALHDYTDMAQRLPTQVSRILQRILESRLSIDFVHKGYDNMLSEMDRATNRLSLSIVIGALIVGSAFVTQSGKGPLLWDFPVFGIIGFLLAGIMGLGLAFVILRSGKL
jgi:ubiquinone biosynthesis protein